MDTLLFTALTADVIGKLFIAYAALRVHHRVLNEHTIDRAVFKTMKKEQKFGIAGAVLIAAGYFIESGILLELL